MSWKNNSRVDSQLAMHDTPRFGHTKEFAAVTSDEGRDDYIDGIVTFAVFIAVLIFIWLMVLLLLKLCCGVESVGWLAGGDIVDVEDMRKQQISRSRRKHRIRRNWRIQSTFLIASMCIPVLSFLLANHGLEPFIKSLSVIEEVSNDVDTRAFVGIQTGKRIKELFQELQNLGSFDIAASCPDFASTYLKNETHLVSIQDELANILSQASPIIDEFIPDTIESLYLITKATAKTDEIVDSILSHDWIVIMLLAVVNIINAFFLFGVFLTKNNLDYPVFQAFTGYLLIPVFGLVVIASVGTSCLFAAASISNADFCAGGNGVRSPIGTFQEMLIQSGYGEGGRSFQALEYYTAGCHAEHPLAILSEAKIVLETSALSLEPFGTTFSSVNQTHLQDECGDAFSFSSAAFVRISENLGLLQDNFDVALDLTSCSSLSPLIQFFSGGSLCGDSINGLNILFSLMLAISVLSMIMLTTRAALFNPVIRAKRIKRREKEFNEYKSYMAKYYDTDLWEMDPPKSFDAIMESSSTMESDDDSFESMFTCSDGSTVDTNEATMRENCYTDKNDVQLKAVQQSENSDDRSVVSASSSFFTFRRKQFHKREVEVVYYSSDSESDDDESASIAMSFNSGISSIAARIKKVSGVVRTGARKSRLKDEGGADEDAESVDGSVSSNIVLFFKRTGRMIRTPSTSRKVNHFGHQDPNACARDRNASNDPLSLGNLEAYRDDEVSESSTGSVDQFLEPPAFRNDGPPRAPQKKVTTVARTTGARDMQ